MQQGLELPPDQYKNIINHRSPQTSNLKLNRYNNNESQESLLYSNSTYKQDTHRSPKFINLPLLDVQKSKIKVEQDKSERRIDEHYNKGRRLSVGQEKKDIVSSAITVNYHQNQTTSTNQIQKLKNKIQTLEKYHPSNLSTQFQQKNERKTMQNTRAEINRLSKRNKELEYALQLQIMTSEELRSKLKIMSETLQKNLKDAGLGDFLKLKNSNNKMSNIDVYVQLQKIRESNSEHEKQLNRLRLQNQNLSKHLSLRSNQIEKLNRKSRTLQNQLKSANQKLKNISTTNQNNEQNQSLVLYIEQLKKQYSNVATKANLSQKLIQQLSNKLTNLQQLQQKKERQTIKQEQVLNQQIYQLNQQITKLKLQLQNQQEALNNNQHQTETLKLQYQHEINSRNQIIQAMEQRILSYENKQNLEHVNVELTDRSAQKSERSIQQSNRKSITKINQSAQKQIEKIIEKLKWENQTTKQQCDYYHGEYLKKMKQSGQLHALKLKYKTEIGVLKKNIKQFAISHNNVAFQQVLDHIQSTFSFI